MVWRLAQITLLWALLVAVTGCNLLGSQPELSLTATRVGTEINVEGASDLPDGTILQYNLWQRDNDPLHASFGETKIASGRYAFSVSIADWPAAPVQVRLAFASGSYQPKAVTDRYGANGERLAGPNVIDDSGRVMVVRATVAEPG